MGTCQYIPYQFFMVYPCFTLEKYTGTYEFPFQALVLTLLDLSHQNVYDNKFKIFKNKWFKSVIKPLCWYTTPVIQKKVFLTFVTFQGCKSSNDIRTSTGRCLTSMPMCWKSPVLSSHCPAYQQPHDLSRWIYHLIKQTWHIAVHCILPFLLCDALPFVHWAGVKSSHRDLDLS